MLGESASRRQWYGMVHTMIYWWQFGARLRSRIYRLHQVQQTALTSPWQQLLYKEPLPLLPRPVLCCDYTKQQDANSKGQSPSAASMVLTRECRWNGLHRCTSSDSSRHLLDRRNLQHSCAAETGHAKLYVRRGPRKREAATYISLTCRQSPVSGDKAAYNRYTAGGVVISTQTVGHGGEGGADCWQPTKSWPSGRLTPSEK
jgi:hypothetical protein